MTEAQFVTEQKTGNCFAYRLKLSKVTHRGATLANQALMQRSANKAADPIGAAQTTGPRHGHLTQLAADLNARWIQRVGVAPAPNRTGLPDTLKAGVEALSGMSLDQVRVHRNSPKPAALQAHAFAQGSEVHLAPGQDQHLPHEAWHVVQQAQGRVRPTLQTKDGIAINNDRALEREADEMGGRASAFTGHAHETAPVQENALSGDAQPLQASALGSASMIVAQRYGDENYQPNLTGLHVPGGGAGAYSYDTFNRPNGWYEDTFSALFALLPENRKRNSLEFNATFVRCAVTNRWHNINDLQIGHIENWRDYVRDTEPATVREATNAYNDLNNLRLEGATANASHDFEDGRDSEEEDEYDGNDGFMDTSDNGVMPDEARQFLDQYRSDHSNTYRI